MPRERYSPLVPIQQPGAGAPQAVLSQAVPDNSALAAALMRQGGGQISSIGGGIGSAARQFTAAGLMRKQQEQEQARMEALSAALSNPDASPEDLARTLAVSGDTSLMKSLIQNRMNPKERRIVKGADGFNYYADTAERVIPGAQAAPEKPTTTMKDYKFYLKNGGKKSFEEFRASGANQINIDQRGNNLGNAPADTAWARNEDGSVKLDDRGVPIALPIQGTKSFRAEEKAASAAAKGDQIKGISSNIVTQDIDRATKLINENPSFTTGFGAAVTSSVPGSPGFNVNELLTTVKGNIGFDKLQSMREASPTGGALGQVSEFENKTLQATMGSLEQSQNKEQLLYNLARIKFITDGVVNGVRDGEAVRPLQPSDVSEFDKRYRESTGDEDAGWQDIDGVKIRRKQ